MKRYFPLTLELRNFLPPSLLHDGNKCNSYTFIEVLGDILHNLIKIHGKQYQICIFQISDLKILISTNVKYFCFQLHSSLTWMCVCVYHWSFIIWNCSAIYTYTHTHKNAHADMHSKSYPECVILPSSLFIYHIVLEDQSLFKLIHIPYAIFSDRKEKTPP